MAVRREINVFGVKNMQICVSDDECIFFIMKENRKSSFIFAKKAVRNSCQCVFYMFVSNRDETRRIHAALITN